MTPAIVTAFATAVATAIDALTAAEIVKMTDALTADGWAPDDIAAVEAWWVAEYLTWRQDTLPALLAAALLEPAIH